MSTYIDIGSGGGGSLFYGDPVATFGDLPVTGLLGEIRITLDTGVLYYWDGAAWNVAETEVATVAHADTDGIDLDTTGSILTATLNLSADAATAGFLKADTTIKSGANKGLHVEIPEATDTQVGVLTLSSDAATAGFLKATTTINSSAGLHVEIPEASDSQIGVLTLSADAATAGFLKATTTIKSGAGLHVEIPEATGSETGVLKSADWTTFNNKEPAITVGTTAQYWRGDKTFQTLRTEALSAQTDGAINDLTYVLGSAEDTKALTTTGVNPTTVWGNVVHRSLTAGTYFVSGMAMFTDNAAVLTDTQQFGISDTVDGSSMGAFDYIEVGYMSSTSGKTFRHALPGKVFASSSAFTVYINSKFSYSAGTPQHGGKLFVQRIR